MSEKSLIASFAQPIEDVAASEVCCEESRSLMKCSVRAIVTTNFGYMGSNRAGRLPGDKAMKMQVSQDACTPKRGKSIQ
jgi:hypothetical protein